MKIFSKLGRATLLCFVALGSAHSEASGIAQRPPVKVMVPLLCTRGDKHQTMRVMLSMPRSQPPGTTFTVQIDGTDSGIISHTGLNYIFDMETDYLVPVGTRWVEGSARIVPATGTANVRPGAKVWKDAAGIHTKLPGHVDDGSRYTPPSLQFQLEVTGAVGSTIALQFARYGVMANAWLVGNVHTICDADPKPFTLGTATIAEHMTSPGDAL